MKRLILLALAVLSLAACRGRCCPDAAARQGEEAATPRLASGTVESHSAKTLPMSDEMGDLLISGDNVTARRGNSGETVFTGDNLSMRFGNVTAWAEEIRFKSDGLHAGPPFVTLHGGVRVESSGGMPHQGKIKARD